MKVAILLVLSALFVNILATPTVLPLVSGVKSSSTLYPSLSTFRHGTYYRIFVPVNANKVTFVFGKDSTCTNLRYAIRTQGFMPCSIDTPNNDFCWDDTYSVFQDYFSSNPTTKHFDLNISPKFFKTEEYWYVAMYKYAASDKDKTCNFEITATIQTCPDGQVASTVTECAPYTNVTLTNPVTVYEFTKENGGSHAIRIPHVEYGTTSLKFTVSASRPTNGIYGRVLGPAFEGNSYYTCSDTSTSGSNPYNYTMECKTPKWDTFYLKLRDSSTLLVTYRVQIERVYCPAGKGGYLCTGDVTPLNLTHIDPYYLFDPISPGYSYRYFTFQITHPPFFNLGPYKITFTNNNGVSQVALFRYNAYPFDDSTEGYDSSNYYSSFTSTGNQAKKTFNAEDFYKAGTWVFGVKCSTTTLTKPCNFSLQVDQPDNTPIEPPPPIAPPIAPSTGYSTTFTGLILPTILDIGDPLAPNLHQFYVPANASKVTMEAENLSPSDCSYLRYILRPNWRPCSESADQRDICYSDSRMLFNDNGNVGSSKSTRSWDTTTDWFRPDSMWNLGVSKYYPSDKSKTCSYRMKITITECPYGQYSTGQDICTPHREIHLSSVKPISDKLSVYTPTGRLFVRIPKLPERTNRIIINVNSTVLITSGIYARFESPVNSGDYNCYTSTKTGDGPFLYSLDCPTPKWSNFFFELRGEQESTLHIVAHAVICPQGTAGPNCQFNVIPYPPSTNGPFYLHSLPNKYAYVYFEFKMPNPPYLFSSDLKIKVTNQNQTSMQTLWRHNAVPTYESSSTGYDSGAYSKSVSSSSFAEFIIHPEDLYFPGSYYLAVVCVSSNTICAFTLDGTSPPPPPVTPTPPTHSPSNTPVPVGPTPHTPTPSDAPTHVTPTPIHSPSDAPIHVTPTPIHSPSNAPVHVVPTPPHTPTPPFTPSSPNTPFVVGNPSAINNPTPVERPGLSGGAIAAIVIVGIFVIAGIAAGITYFVNKSKQKVQSESLQEHLLVPEEKPK